MRGISNKICLARDRSDPDDRYSVGLLYPRRDINAGFTALNVEVEDTNETVDSVAFDEDHDVGDDVSNKFSGGSTSIDDVGVMTTTFKPSAMGISFVVNDADADQIHVSVSAGLYIKREAIKRGNVSGCATDDDVAKIACKTVVPDFDEDLFKDYFSELSCRKKRTAGS